MKTFAALFVLSFVACGGDPAGPAPPDDPGRRIAFREALKRELGAQYDLPLPSLDPVNHAQGAEIYARLCESCHGLAARGNGLSGRMLSPTPPPDLADPEQRTFFSERAQLQIVERGIPGTPMIGWRQVLNEAEREVVLQYMLDLAASDPVSGRPEGR